jgi:nucleotide-binding universal stress UspA family protein
MAVGESYGVPVVGRLERARAAGPAIVAEAEARQTEIIVLGSRRAELTARQRAVFGKTVDYVLKNAPCRTLVVASGRT